jgi:hypothetical protein
VLLGSSPQPQPHLRPTWQGGSQPARQPGSCSCTACLPQHAYAFGTPNRHFIGLPQSRKLNRREGAFEFEAKAPGHRLSIILPPIIFFKPIQHAQPTTHAQDADPGEGPLILCAAPFVLALSSCMLLGPGCCLRSLPCGVGDAAAVLLWLAQHTNNNQPVVATCPAGSLCSCWPWCCSMWVQDSASSPVPESALPGGQQQSWLLTALWHGVMRGLMAASRRSLQPCQSGCRPMQLQRQWRASACTATAHTTTHSNCRQTSCLCCVSWTCGVWQSLGHGWMTLSLMSLQTQHNSHQSCQQRFQHA